MRHFLSKAALLAVLAVFFTFNLQAQKTAYNDSWGTQGLSIEAQKDNGLTLNYSITEFTLVENNIKDQVMKSVKMPGSLLPNNAGKPDLPGVGQLIALPEGAKATLKVTDYKTEIIENIAIAPAPVIPFDTDKKPMKYEKDSKVYSQDRFYPANPFKLSQKLEIRGVDVVTLGITPFQYNPVTKELKIYRDIKFEVVFEGGKGQYGEDKYRSVFWESTLSQNLINYNALPKIDFNKETNRTKDGEADYVIITIDDPDFIAKANEIAEFRRKQGISTMVLTTADLGGNTIANIENWVDDAYNNWSNPIDAVLLLGDYSTSSDGITSHLYEHPYWGADDFASDNKYADVDGDELPDVVFARITAENTDQLNTMVSKFMDYEQNPPTDASFYDNPITALGWQTERWFQICSEVVGGFWNNELGKNTVRINAVYDGNPSSDPWSTATNTSTVIDYFGPNGLGYIPATPDELGGWTGGTAGDVTNAINSGAFMLQHRDHGFYGGWGEPDFTTGDISTLTNVDNKLPFIFSINCQTGAFHNPGADPTFTEAFHRYSYNGENSGALGLIAATEVSYSFVNDTYVWGLFDNMWPDFMPDETAEFPVNFVYPAFGNTAAKIFLYQSSWPYNTDSKEITYRLFHHHGDAYLNVFTEVPQDLTVNAPSSHIFGSSTIDISADAGSTIAVTYYNDTEGKTEILGTAISAGGNNTITLNTVPNPGTEMLVTVTKQNYFRHTSNVTVIAPSGPFDVIEDFAINDGDNGEAEFAETFDIDITVKNVGVDLSEDVTVSLTTTDPNVVSLTNATDVSFGDIPAGSTATSSGSFSVALANDIPDQTTISFDATITDAATKSTYEGTVSFKVNAPVLTIGSLVIDDPTGNGDGILDPGETADIIIETTNDGHADVSNVIGTITSTSADLTLNSTTTSPANLTAGASETFTFNVTADIATPEGTPADIDYSITAGADDQYSATETKTVVIGFVPEYCEAGSNDTSDEFIERVQIGDIDNTSGSSSYTDFTHISTDVMPGESYPITVTNGYHFSGDEIGCWVDWNYDGDFEDANETISMTYSDPEGTGTITVPVDAHIGQLTMRTRVVYSASLSPCGYSSYGEVEDYTLNVTPGNIYSGTASANPTVICESGPTTLTLSNWIGDDIQWQESSDGSTWTDISGATSDEYTTAELTEIKHFRAQVNASGEDPVFSNVVTIEIETTPIGGTATLSDNSICEGESVDLSLSGYEGNFIQWQYSTDGSTWNDVSGGTSATHTTESLYENVYYMAEVTNNACDPVYSTSVFVVVNPYPSAGAMNVNASDICEGETITLELTGHTGDVQWQMSEDGSTWTDIAAAHNATYTSEPLMESCYFRSMITTSCGEEYSDAMEISVYAAPVSAFSFITDSLEVSFTNESENANSYQWDFGDENGTSTDENPVYEYADEGTYTITLTSANDHCTEHQSFQDVTISITSVENLSSMGIEVFPNPTQGVFQVKASNNTEMTIMNSTGKIVHQKVINESRTEIDIQSLPDGYYIIRFITGDRLAYKKIIKN